ncbi:MAG: NAD(P)/FAD-dependent oxidoreductase [Pseudomonadota bacterium]|nr:NAD(P)/FAD-dependent oxidoreductase [Pseudomonadota bacterium]
MSNFERRDFLKAMGAAAAGSLTWPVSALGAGKISGKIVIVGGGFGGATCARYLRRWGGPDLDITVIEKSPTYTTCVLSNEVIVGDMELEDLTHDYSSLKGGRKINFIHDEVAAIDPAGKQVTLKGGDSVGYDKLVVSPGISFKFGAVENDEEAVKEAMPHAYLKAGEQTLLLRKQLMAMEDGGTVIIVPPKKPFRCPPGPYERASLIAHYLKNNKPKSKVLIIDANESHSKQAAFNEGWKAEYPGMIEWVQGSLGGDAEAVDIASMTVIAGFGEKYKGDVINLIPRQQAGAIAVQTDLVNADGWCPVDWRTFESTIHPDIHVIGDSALAEPMPKSAHVAAAHAKVCAAAIVSNLAGAEPPEPAMANTCYSLIKPRYAISVAQVYRLVDGKITQVSGWPTKTGLPMKYHKKEAKALKGWYKSIVRDMLE